MQVPDNASGPLPVIVALHASWSRWEHFRGRTCPDGDVNSADCFVTRAAEQGFVVVIPSGTGELILDELRGWNAGGHPAIGVGMRCVSGRACRESIDDVSYLDAVLNEVKATVNVDTTRVHITGMGSGAAMAHRAVCERATVYASVVAVAGLNQHGAQDGCFPARPVPMLQVHGDSDRCWGIDGTSSCNGDDAGPLVTLDDSMEGWRQRNGCTTNTTTDVIGGVDVTNFTGCEDDVTTATVTVGGHGHGWPGGHQWAGADSIGPIRADVSATDMALDFFNRHTLPESLSR